MKVALFDADYLLYRIGHGKKDMPVFDAIASLDELIYSSLEPLSVDVTLFFLTDPNGTFRHRLYPDYKANRRQPKPEHFDALWEHMVGSWCADVAVDIEADDMLSLENGPEHILVSIDKDLLQVPGQHYNPVKNVLTDISERAGMHNLYTQILTGDSVDNIKGVPGIGPKKAEQILIDCQTEEEYAAAVETAYKARFGESYREEMVKNAILVQLLRKDWECLILRNHRELTKQHSKPIAPQ